MAGSPGPTNKHDDLMLDAAIPHGAVFHGEALWIKKRLIEAALAGQLGLLSR